MALTVPGLAENDWGYIFSCELQASGCSVIYEIADAVVMDMTDFIVMIPGGNDAKFFYCFIIKIEVEPVGNGLLDWTSCYDCDFAVLCNIIEGSYCTGHRSKIIAHRVKKDIGEYLFHQFCWNINTMFQLEIGYTFFGERTIIVFFARQADKDLRSIRNNTVKIKTNLVNWD